MRLFLVITLFVATIAAAVITWQFIRDPEESMAPVPAGDIEIAWIQAATSISGWERFVAGVHRMKRSWPESSVDDSRAFPEETTAMPQLTISVAGKSKQIHVRWYKLSKGTTAQSWVKRLAQRNPAPTVVIGGGSSDRALDLAQAMADEKHWQGEQPLLFFTTATASIIASKDDGTTLDLMQVYPGRSYRMCFTNQQIASALIDFVWSQPDLKPFGNPVPAIRIVGLSDPLQSASTLVLHEEVFSPSVYALEWDDDPYSIDLSSQFHDALHEASPGQVLVRETIRIPFSVGGQYSSNPAEAEAAERLLNAFREAPLERQLLLLPTAAAPARRVLRSITGALPLVGRNLVAITGDSISLNNVYRDSDIG